MRCLRGLSYGGEVKAPRIATPPLSPKRAVTVLTAAALMMGLASGGSIAVAAPEFVPAGQPAEDFPPELASFYTQTLTWAPCKAGLQCTWLTVPLDYADPAGATIRLRVSKVPASGPAGGRQGSLVINPGGPGGSVVDFTAVVAFSIAPKVNTQFDVVGFDPRGVGQSAPITCLTGRQTSVWLQQDGTPDTAAEERRLMALARGIGNGCLRLSPDLARHVGTDDTVKDMDILRQALGDAKLNWLGFSYGTYMGTLYAEAYPDRVGRFVLDGPIDPANDGMQMSRGQSRGFQVALTRFASDCATRPTCPYHGGAKSVLRGINVLLARLDSRPMPAGTGRRLSQADALSAVSYAMYSRFLWPSLRLGLQLARHGDGSGLASMSDDANHRIGPNTYATNMASAFYAIGCWDLPASPGAAGLRAAAARWSSHAPVPEMAKAMSWGNAPCSLWYGHTARQPAPASTTTTAPIVVVGTLYDPATPYPWAISLSKQLPTATLLTYNGDGHTAYGSGSRCIDNALETYLLTGSPPAPGTVCT
jgi:pimeloyl-ACP methyl ester carboxylesterase